MHLSGDKELNLPYYLLKILTKMARRVQIHPESAHRSLYHQGLIKLLVSFALEELEMPWGYFLKSVGLKEQEQVPDSQNEGDASKDKTEVRVSLDPGSSMKPVQPTTNKGKGPKTRNTPSKENKPETPMKEESPRMQLRSSMGKGKERKSGKASHMHPPTLETPQRSLSSNHSEEEQRTPIKQQPKKPVTRMRGKLGSRSCNNEVVKGKVVPTKALPKTSPASRQDRKRKGEQNIETPSKPNRKTRITNQLRLNSKALFKPSLKDPQPIVIEDDDNPEFSSMEEMEVNVLKGMTVKKEKSNPNEGETAETPFVTVKKEYPTDSSQQQGTQIMDLILRKTLLAPHHMQGILTTVHKTLNQRLKLILWEYRGPLKEHKERNLR
jgi:hypothetical protein